MSKEWKKTGIVILVCVAIFGVASYMMRPVRPVVDLADGLSYQECDVVLSGEKFRVKNIRYAPVPEDWIKTEEAYVESACVAKRAADRAADSVDNIKKKTKDAAKNLFEKIK